MSVTACGGGNGQRSEKDASGRSPPSVAHQSPSTPASDATGGNASAPPSSAIPPVTPPPRNPDEGRQLREEVERLERQGNLPNLDRGADIAGVDVDRNGVRDDVDAYIAALPISNLQKRAVTQRAREQQTELLLDPTDKQAVAASSKRSMAAATCMWNRFNRSDDLSTRIEAITANTPERARRYMRFMAALSGTSVRAPVGDTCEP